MSYRRRQATLARAVANSRGRNLNPKGWGENIVPGIKVTTFGRHGWGQPAIDGTVEAVVDGTVVIRVYPGGELRNRSLSNVRRVG